MKWQCASTECKKNEKTGPKLGRVVRNGVFYRKSDSRRIERWRCLGCGRSFSRATGTACFRQHRRRLNIEVQRRLCSAMSMRDVARTLGCTRNTVTRKLLFLAAQARLHHLEYLNRIRLHPKVAVQFDEMETFEHSKCKPVSIALAVLDGSRKILGVEVSQMPAKGPLARVSNQKYGKRADFRRQGLDRLFESLSKMLPEDVELSSDQCPRYPPVVRKHLQQATHNRYKGRRGCVVGQGELKRGGFDPLFSLNHTAAMFRAHMNRLVRRTWSTTKKLERLEAHLWVYLHYHNTVLT